MALVISILVCRLGSALQRGSWGKGKYQRPSYGGHVVDAPGIKA